MYIRYISISIYIHTYIYIHIYTHIYKIIDGDIYIYIYRHIHGAFGRAPAGPRYVAAKRFVKDPAAERERQRQELLADLEAAGFGTLGPPRTYLEDRETS